VVGVMEASVVDIVIAFHDRMSFRSPSYVMLC
jgi:hypothetical protein